MGETCVPQKCFTTLTFVNLSGHIDVLTSWVSYIQTFINPGILNYAQGFLRPWEKHVCHKSASLH